MTRTLSVEEVLNRYIMGVALQRLLSEDVLCRAHELLRVLLFQGVHVMANICTAELGLEWYLLQLHTMDAGACDTQQRGGCGESLHDYEGFDKLLSKKDRRYKITK
jgi:hypothetical protein